MAGRQAAQAGAPAGRRGPWVEWVPASWRLKDKSARRAVKWHSPSIHVAVSTFPQPLTSSAPRPGPATLRAADAVFKIHLELQVFTSAHLFTNVSSSSLDSCCDWRARTRAQTHTHAHTHTSHPQAAAEFRVLPSFHSGTSIRVSGRRWELRMHCPGGDD